MNYPYSAYPNRGKLTLPGGCKLGLIMTINLEYWDLTKNSEQPITQEARRYSLIRYPQTSLTFQLYVEGVRAACWCMAALRYF
jgi:hypothetical protein